MKNVTLLQRVTRMSLLAMAPVVALFAVCSLAICSGLSLSMSIRSLARESYLSQIYITHRLSAYSDADILSRELETLAFSLCNTLSDAADTRTDSRVQILSPGQGLLGDSNIPDDLTITEDVGDALNGNEAYTFFFRGHRLHISYSGPIYSGGRIIGVIRYVERPGVFSHSSRIGMSFFLLWVFSVASWYAAAHLLADKICAPMNSLQDSVRRMKDGAEVDLDAAHLDEETKEVALAYYAIQESNNRNLRRLRLERERQSLFFSRATHQLKTPLTSIIGYSQMIGRLTDEEDAVKSAAYIEQAGIVLLKMSDDMLEISRYRHSGYEFTPSWFSLGELCAECLEVLAPQLEEEDIFTDDQSGAVEVFFDRRCVREVLLNILDNCIRHSRCRRISISTATLPVRLMVEDDGIGVEKHQLDQIFEPFYSLRRKSSGGSGLGLAICREMMTGQGGDVTAQLAENGGMRFTVYFQDKDEPHKWVGKLARRI